jgi:hypothetical protein
LAERQGTVFRPVAERLAESDPDALVRELADLYRQRWDAARRPDTGNGGW